MIESFSVYKDEKDTISCCADVHGKFKDLNRIIEKELEFNKNQRIFQLGDLGIGFLDHKYPEKFVDNFRFLYGNHDQRDECLKHPNCLGDFGYIKDINTYFISGAWSIDHANRTEGVNWWANEELTDDQFQQIEREVVEYKPRIILSHDCPSFIRKDMFGFDRFYETRTGLALNKIFEAHKPIYWVFAHYHRSSQHTIEGTHFICLSELEWCRIPLT